MRQRLAQQRLMPQFRMPAHRTQRLRMTAAAAVVDIPVAANAGNL
jgi:hypothetical protein